jgi:hypothetical protein
MRSEHEAMMVVRAELCDRLEALRRFSRKQPAGDFTESVIGIRRLAAAYGLSPVVRVSEAFEAAMTRAEAAGPCQKSLYIDRLYDAIGCEGLDDQASEAMIASVSVRFV